MKDIRHSSVIDQLDIRLFNQRPVDQWAWLCIHAEHIHAFIIHDLYNTFIIYMRLLIEISFSNSMSAGSVLEVKMARLDRARAKGRSHSEEGAQTYMKHEVVRGIDKCTIRSLYCAKTVT